MPNHSPIRAPGNFSPYNREQARAYALHWALGRNPQYYDFSKIGGDCTNFASQVLYAGGSVMNYDPVEGWYYLDANRKSPSWTGVNFLYNFLVTNRTRGPFGQPVNWTEIQVGDLIQLSFRGGGFFNHSLVVTTVESPPQLDRIYVSTHTANRRNVKLVPTYNWVEIRFIHILGNYL